MKRTGKSVSFIVVAVILLLAFTACFGVSNYFGDIRTTYFKGVEDIRWGIDISGGVEAIFVPDKNVGDISDEDMDSAKEIISTRLLYNNITDSEIYVDYDNCQVIVRFPWKSDEENYDPTAAIKELGEMAVLTFREGNNDKEGAIVLQGAGDIESASHVQVDRGRTAREPFYNVDVAAWTSCGVDRAVHNRLMHIEVGGGLVRDRQRVTCEVDLRIVAVRRHEKRADAA